MEIKSTYIRIKQQGQGARISHQNNFLSTNNIYFKYEKLFIKISHQGLAQLVEHPPNERKRVGSTPMFLILFAQLL